MIEFTNVSVDVDEYDVEGRHRRVKILSTMNLIVSERRVAVIGPNGAGKSTLLRLVNGLVEATDGTVTVDGINPSEDGRAARRHVGYIFTNPMSQLVMSTPVADVELSLRQRIRNRLERHEAAMQILADQGLEAVAGRSVHALSGGERQLVSLRAYWPSNHQSSSPTSQQPCWICETGRWCGTPLNAWISKSCAAPMTWNWRRRLTECWLSKTVELSTTATRGRLLPTIGPGWCPVKAGSCLDAVDRIRADED